MMAHIALAMMQSRHHTVLILAGENPSYERLSCVSCGRFEFLGSCPISTKVERYCASQPAR